MGRLAYHCSHAPSITFHEGRRSLHFLAPSSPWSPIPVLGSGHQLSSGARYNHPRSHASPQNLFSFNLASANININNFSKATLRQRLVLNQSNWIGRRFQFIPEATVKVNSTTLTLFLRPGEIIVSPDP